MPSPASGLSDVHYVLHPDRPVSMRRPKGDASTVVGLLGVAGIAGSENIVDRDDVLDILGHPSTPVGVASAPDRVDGTTLKLIDQLSVAQALERARFLPLPFPFPLPLPLPDLPDEPLDERRPRGSVPVCSL
jgi:hypothetical protein